MDGSTHRLTENRYSFSLSEISSNKRKDRDVSLSVAIMNMAESKPRPLPKPRARHKSVPANTTESDSVSPKIPNSAPAIKPPITKPKPGYKPLVFDSKTLVSIEADIDIDIGSTATVESNDSKGIEDFEKNNNVANLKHGNSKNLIGNGRKTGGKVSTFFREVKTRSEFMCVVTSTTAFVELTLSMYCDNFTTSLSVSYNYTLFPFLSSQLDQ